MSRKVLLYIWLLTLGAILLLAVTASKIQSAAWPSLLFFILVAVLVEFLPIELPTGQHLTLSAAVGITILTNYGWPMAIWVATISVLMEAAFRRTPYYRALFNASQYVLTMAAAGLVFMLTGGQVGVVDFTRPLPLLAILVTDFLCNTTLISGLFALLSRRGIVKVWTEMVKDSYQSSLATLVIGFVSARILNLDGFAGYTVLLAFLFMLQRIFQTYFKLFSSTEERRSELEAVLNATESGILMVDTGGNVRIVNRRIEEIFGLPENCPLGLDHAAAESGPQYAEFETHLEGGARKIIRRFTAPVLNKDGQRLGTVSSFTDITAERDAGARLHELQHASIRALVAAVDARDPYTHGHSERVSEYAVLLAREIGLPDQEVEVIRHAALMHDIGKIGLDDHILRKSGPLDVKERALVIQHPMKGVSILEENAAFANLVPIVKYHHEWFGGGGYPSGIAGEAIPLEARILAIADAFDAMTSDRPYRRALSPQMAIEEVRLGRGTQFDPELADKFVSLVERGKIRLHRRTGRGFQTGHAVQPLEGKGSLGRILPVHGKELSILYQISLEGRSVLELPRLTRRVLEILHSTLGGYAYRVWLNDPESGRLEPLGSIGWPDVALAEDSVPPGAVRWVQEHSEALVIADAANDPRFGEDGLRGMRSRTVVPLTSGGRVIGVLDVQADTPGAFEVDSVALIMAVAGQLASLVEVAIY